MRNRHDIGKSDLEDLYLKKGLSLQEVAKNLSCSVHKVRYWMVKNNIKTRSISDAVYLKCNPDGDPFVYREPKNLYDAELFGFGLGLYWGEGTKADKWSVKLGNTDPELLRKFMEFLTKTFNVKKEDFKFGLQIFTDIDVRSAMDFWAKKLKIKHSQFYKPTVTISGSIGTYRKKSKYGVLTVHYHNKKLRDILVNMLPM